MSEINIGRNIQVRTGGWVYSAPPPLGWEYGFQNPPTEYAGFGLVAPGVDGEPAIFLTVRAEDALRAIVQQHPQLTLRVVAEVLAGSRTASTQQPYPPVFP